MPERLYSRFHIHLADNSNLLHFTWKKKNVLRNITECQTDCFETQLKDWFILLEIVLRKKQISVLYTEW